MISKHVFFTGFMGSGKSLIGKRVSESYGLPFVDLDNLIVDDLQMSIKQIFSKIGEKRFRLLETGFLERISVRTKPHIVALGGGAICSQRNLDICKRTGYVIFLDVMVDLLVERLMRNKNRPLLLDENGNLKPETEVQQIVREMLEKRRIWYEKADICLKINHEMEKEEVTSFVLEHLNKISL